jgi:hypothetical protein
VRITDVSAAGGGRAYLVERELEKDGYGAVRLGNHVQCVEMLHTPPRGRSSIDAAAGTGSQRRSTCQASQTALDQDGNRVGERRELARYTVPSGERTLYGRGTTH